MKSDAVYTGDKMLDAKDLQEKWGFSRAIAYQLLNREDVKPVKIGRRRFVRESRLVEWLESQENGQAAGA